MIYPSIDKLLTLVPSKYALVYIASSRSKQMEKNNYYQKESQTQREGINKDTKCRQH